MITVKDIRTKEFTRTTRGYKIEEVDDFLDQIADQVSELIKEFKAASEKAENAQAEIDAAKAEASNAIANAQAAQPVQVVSTVNTSVEENQYFENFKNSLSETLRSAQKTADDTVAEARKKANALIEEAEQQAAAITTAANAEADKARAEAEGVKAAAEDYKGRFIRLLEEQAHLLKADESLFN